MKRRKIVAAVLAFSLIATMCCGCNLLGGGNSGRSSRHHDDDDDEEPEQTIEETSEDTEDTEVSSETTPKTEDTESTGESGTEGSSEVTEVTAEPLVGLPEIGVDVSEQFQMLRDYAQQYSLAHEGSTFGYEKIYGDGDLGYELIINSPDEGLMAFEWDGQDINQLEPTYINERSCLSYNAFFSLPCPFDTSFVYDCDMLWPTDGTYYGSIVALRLDAGAALVTYGDAYTMTEAEVGALSVGDVVTLPSPMYETTQITVSNISTDSSGHACIFFDESVYLEWNGDSYMLYGESDNPVVLELHMATVPISENVTIDANFSLFVEDQAAYQQFADTYGNGNAILESDYYYTQYVAPTYTVYTSDGWAEGYGLLYPFTISNGYITDMNISWR